MKKEEFKRILPEHFESCRQFIVNRNGECNLSYAKIALSTKKTE